MPRQSGFSFIELVIATAITLSVVAAVFAMARSSNREFDTGLELADQQQRVRVAVDTLTRDLTMAGAGAYIGGHVGPLIHYFAPVMPFRWSQSGGDPPGTFRTDAITIVSVPVNGGADDARRRFHRVGPHAPDHGGIELSCRDQPVRLHPGHDGARLRRYG